MKITKITAAGWQDRLDSSWKALPVEQQRRYTRLLFIAYLCITAGIGVQYCAQAKRAQPVLIQHIDNRELTTAAGEQGNHKTIKKQSYENR